VQHGALEGRRSQIALHELIDRAMREGAREITRHGRPAVVVSAEEWDRKTRRKEELAQFLERSALRGCGLEVERLPDLAPDVEL
jgi:prevent-host-death family protein